MEHGTMKFIAMEYYGLILNRTFEVFFMSDSLLGRKTGGIVVASPFHLTAKYQKAEAFTDKGSIGDQVDESKILSGNKANFKIKFSEIGNVEFLKKKKWGMGPVAHTGILNIFSKNGGITRELIILGDQDGEAILHELKLRKIP